MRRRSRLPELLAPAGSPDALRAAVAGGADAIYLGGSGFNARAGAVNFDDAAMAEAVSYCHAYGVSVYVTLNTLLYDREMADFLSYAASLYRLGVDAVIVADRGAMRLLARYIPGLAVHASTQASAHSVGGVRELSALGATRAVPARELSLADIRTLVEGTDAEIEVFLHGALCVSHSGQCLFSSLVGGRSGNRGECAQPCRLPYNGAYPISLRDLSLADHIPALIESGVASLKIEGRMKSPAYVYGVTSIYRRLLDEGRVATAEEKRALRELFSRGGFTDAYFTGRLSSPMLGVRSEADKQNTRALDPVPIGERKIMLTGQLTVRPDEPCSLTLSREDGRTATALGERPLPAKNAPLSAEDLSARIGKTGGTPYAFAPGGLTVDLSPGLFLSPGAVNALRRAAIAALSALPRERADFALPPGAPALPTPQKEAPPDTALCYFTAQADALRAAGFPGLIFLPLTEWEKAKTRPHGIYVPPVVTDHEKEEVLSLLERARESGITQALCGNAGMIEELLTRAFTVHGDFRLNVTNRESACLWQARGLASCVLSPELTLPQLRDIGWGSAIVYGRIPLMLTERCFQKDIGGCAACNRASLTDRRGVTFPLLREYRHRTLICNSLPTYMGDRQEEYARTGRSCHFLFTTESGEETASVYSAFRAARPLGMTVRRIAAVKQKEKKHDK